MKKQLLTMTLLAVSGMFAVQLHAVPAKPGIRAMQQADGSEILVRLAGDEYHHQYFSEDGYPLAWVDGYFHYMDVDGAGNIVDSGIKATSPALRDASALSFISGIDMPGLEGRIQKRASMSPRRQITAEKMEAAAKAPAKAAAQDGVPFEKGYGLFPGADFPAYGNQKGLCILVEYADVKFNNVYDPYEYFYNMLNQEGFSQYGGTGSAADYFRECSNGTFTPTFDVFGPVTLPNAMSYYGGNDSSGNDKNPAAMAKHACDILDPLVDFTDYDRDGDGIVDNVYIIYAGKGEATNGSASSVWPHSWHVEYDANFRDASTRTYDGVVISSYACSNEWEQNSPDGIGTFIHEFSHVLGLPDLYATSYTTAFTPGEWSVLDMGPYNNNSRTPPAYGVFERYALGWMKPLEIKEAVSATLPKISENVGGIIRTGKDTEFFLLENKQKEGWNKYIPGHGLVVWHIDYVSSVWTRNTVNNTAAHQYVDLEEADGTQSQYSVPGDAFPGTGKKTSFTPTTNPAMKNWAGEAIDFPITNIAETDDIITFDVLGGGTKEFPDLAVEEAKELSHKSFVIEWTPVEGFDAIVNVYKRPAKEEAATRAEEEGTEDETEEAQSVYDGTEEFVAGYKNLVVCGESSVTVEGLEPETEYYYTVVPTIGWQTAEATKEFKVVTVHRPLSECKVNLLEAEDVTSSSFTAKWESLEEATGYELSVFEVGEGKPFEATCDFTGSDESLGEWKTTSTDYISTEGYYGAAAPALQLSGSQTLSSPRKETDVNGFSFWHRGNGTGEDDVLNVYAVGMSGQTLLEEMSVTTAENGETREFTEIPEGTKRIVLEFKKGSGIGTVAIDDVKLLYGHEIAYIPVAGYESLNVGNVESYAVTDLNYATDYVYSVVGTADGVSTADSGFMQVRTGTPAAVEEIPAGQVSAQLVVDGYLVTSQGGHEIEIHDFAGVLVARGKGSVVLPGPGLYVATVRAENVVRKLLVK